MEHHEIKDRILKNSDIIWFYIIINLCNLT
jgi:hypothetical protein